MRTLQRLGSLTALVVLGSIITLAAGQQVPTFTPEQEARLRIREVMDGLYVIPGFDGGQSGGNVAVRVTDDGVIIVDDKFPYSFDFITEQVRSVTDQPIKYVLNTHHHGDHAGSNADFMQSAEVIAHKNARANIVRNNLAGAPRVIFADETAVFLGDAEVRMHHFGRGHTNGDAVVYFPDLRAVHTGDLFVFGERLDGSTLSPFWDFGNGGSVLEWPATADPPAGARLRHRDPGSRTDPEQGRHQDVPRQARDRDRSGPHRNRGRRDARRHRLSGRNDGPGLAARTRAHPERIRRGERSPLVTHFGTKGCGRSPLPKR